MGFFSFVAIVITKLASQGVVCTGNAPPPSQAFEHLFQFGGNMWGNSVGCSLGGGSMSLRASVQTFLLLLIDSAYEDVMF